MAKKKKKNKEVRKPIIIHIPEKIKPLSSGDYVSEAARKDYNYAVSATTASSISLMALSAEEKKMRLDEIKFQVGADWLPVKLNFKWKKK